MTTNERRRRSQEAQTTELGIGGRRVPVHSHLVSIWETEEDFSEFVGFLDAGLHGLDHCVLVEDGKNGGRTLAILRGRGIDVDRVLAERRLVVIAPETTARATLQRVAAAFESAVAAGAPMVRLCGNVDWGHDAGTAGVEPLEYEKGLTAFAERFPSVILCLQHVGALTVPTARIGVLGAHERMLEDQSRGSAEILRVIFDNIPVMLSLRDPAGRLLLVNREWERILGWSLRDAQSHDVLAESYPDPEMRRRALESIRRADRDWTDLSTLTRDGRTIETSWARVSLSDGTRIGIGRDITERKRGEEALLRSEQRFRAIFDSVHDAVAIADDAGHYLEVNPAACALFGRDREDILGRLLTDFSAPGQEVQKAWNEFRSGELDIGEWRFLRPDGSTREAEFTAAPNFLPGQHLAVLRDVTERKRLQRDLRRSEAYLAEGQRLSQTGSWAWTVDTGEILWSPETFRIVGVDATAGEPSYAWFVERLPPEDRERLEKELKASLTKRTEFDVHFRFVLPDGTIKFIHSRGRPSDDASDTSLKYVGVLTDETERRVAEERLQRLSEDLRALSDRLRLVREDERARMARRVHDDVGQSLTALRLDVAWLERRLARPGQPAELEAKLRSMSGLIDTTLDTVQRIATELRPGVLDELGLEAAVEWYLREFEERSGIACKLRSDLEKQPTEPACETAAFRILQEALTNVARHAVATRVRIHLVSSDEGLRLEIRDNGRGIPADRIVSSDSLGLVGMRERARALGGEVAISAAAGRGTTVTVTIPG